LITIKPTLDDLCFHRPIEGLAAPPRRETVMTRDDLRRELPLLFAFAKVLLLDRDDASARMRRWLKAYSASELLAWSGRTDAYRDLMTACQVHPGASRPGKASKGDPLASGLLRQMTAAQRARCFLAGPCGFSLELADKIVRPARTGRSRWDERGRHGPSAAQ
jgi:hypothetical protein